MEFDFLSFTLHVQHAFYVNGFLMVYLALLKIGKGFSK